MNRDGGSTLVFNAGGRLSSSLSLVSHVVIPLALVLLASFFLMELHGDQHLARWIYQAQGHAWTMKNAWITEQVIHKGGALCPSLQD